jgi:tRNA(Ile)-lysidine synthase
MAPLGPFEKNPKLAIAVSGGADSMALLLLAARWAKRRHGQLAALTVDHGLRRQAASEARQVAAWCKALKIEHRTLQWRGQKPSAGIQASAREARYWLMTDYCRRHGVLHLMTAHHLEDQAETVLLRLARRSGLLGLAAMPALSHRRGIRLLRPLLPVRRARLRTFLAARQQAWIEDPSNIDRKFTRVRARQTLSRSNQDLDLSGGFSHLATMAGEHRHQAMAMLAGNAARAVELFTAGYARVDLKRLGEMSADERDLLLAALLTTVGGRQFFPEQQALARVIDAISAGSRRTLHGCLLVPRALELLICREPGRLPLRLSIGGGKTRWDRFRIDFPVRRSDLTVGALEPSGWRQIRGQADIRSLPAVIRSGLPALRIGEHVIAVPHLGYADSRCALPLQRFSAIFAPPRPFLEFGLRVVC